MSKYNLPPIIADRYRLLDVLGQGGMAIVYRAHDEMLARQVAIKFLATDAEKSLDVERFLREARALARLSHPNIATIFDAGQHEDLHYIVLELVQGQDLNVHTQGGMLDLKTIIKIITQVLQGLAYIHGQGIIHRDVKPENIMLTEDGQVKLADFGLALVPTDTRLTETDMIVGTVLYLAPEAITTGNIDHRADLYALGAVFYELLTGQTPYQGDSPTQVLARVMQNAITPPHLVNPSVPDEIETIVLKLLAKDPDQRYGSVGDVLDALPSPETLARLASEQIKRATSDKLKRSLLERIVHSSAAIDRPDGANDEDDGRDTLLGIPADAQSLADAGALLVYAAQEDTVAAVEAARRQIARDIEDMLVNQLNLIISQAGAYEQTITHPQARMAISVLTTLLRQAVQNARDLESSLHPGALETLGLEPALETLAAQEQRRRGLHLDLRLQRLRERLPLQVELALFRVTQTAIERASSVGKATRITVDLTREAHVLHFSVSDNGTLPPNIESALYATRQRIENLGGEITLGHSDNGGLRIAIAFHFAPPVDLTEREMEVLALLAEGLTNKEIAALLVISPRTVKFHLDNIYSKLGVSTRTEAAIIALRRGWVRGNLST